LLTKATSIDPTVVDVAGSDANLFVGSQSYMAHAVVRQLQDRIAAQFIASAQGEDLDRKLWDEYKLPRQGAAAAVGSVRFFRTSSAAGGGSVDVGTKLTTLTGIEYVTETTAVFGPTDLEATADVRATSAGFAFEVGRNQIRNVPASTLFDNTIQATNDDPTAGGEDREEDADYRTRGQNFWPSARRGTLAAIAFGAQSTPGVFSAYAQEELDGNGKPARVCSVYIADSAGLASQALGAVVTGQLEDYRAAGIQAPVQLAFPLIVPVTLALTFTAGTVTAPLVTLIRNAIVAFVNSTPNSAPLYRAGLNTVLVRFQKQGLVPNQSSIVEPGGDIIPPAGQTIRTTPAQVTFQ
jgi:uncharacterized phage protein gp47/JayE